LPIAQDDFNQNLPKNEEEIHLKKIEIKVFTKNFTNSDMDIKSNKENSV